MAVLPKKSASVIFLRDTAHLMSGNELYAEYGGKKEEHYKNLHQSIRLIREEGRWIPALPSRSDT